jgi:Topoisomerase IB
MKRRTKRGEGENGNGTGEGNGARVAPPESIEAAKEAGLRYVNDDLPGISRVAAGKGVSYRRPDGTVVKDRETLARIKRLAIPPAWTDVWICPWANGHIQATGRDQRRRKQYRYHPEWSAVRDGAKFERMIAFGKALPRIRRRVAKDLRRRKLDRAKVLAAVVRLLEATLVRVGNEEYAKQNRSFGLTTMRDRHVRVSRGRMRFDFRGKSGKRHEIDLHDARLAEIVRRTQELPGQDLFQYLDENDEPQKIGSSEVNEYLREIAGEEFSAKDFRTWAGTVLAAVALRELEKAETKAQTKKNLVQAIEAVAQRLGNTPAVCRKCYIHPVVLESYLDGLTIERVKAKARALGARAAGGNGGGAAAGVELNEEERAVLGFLQRKLPTTGERLAASIKAEKRKRGRKGERAA